MSTLKNVSHVIFDMDGLLLGKWPHHDFHSIILFWCFWLIRKTRLVHVNGFIFGSNETIVW